MNSDREPSQDGTPAGSPAHQPTEFCPAVAGDPGEPTPVHWPRLRRIVRWHTRPMVAEEDLAAECEHFLAGTYESFLEGLGEPVPLWARLNAVAHGSTAELVTSASLVRTAATKPRRTMSWTTSRAHMADALLRCAAAQGIAPWELQLDSLVPLESLLIGVAHRRQTPRPRDPVHLLAIVEATLRGHPSAPTTGGGWS